MGHTRSSQKKTSQSCLLTENLDKLEHPIKKEDQAVIDFDDVNEVKEEEPPPAKEEERMTGQRHHT